MHQWCPLIGERTVSKIEKHEEDLKDIIKTEKTIVEAITRGGYTPKKFEYDTFENRNFVYNLQI